MPGGCLPSLNLLLLPVAGALCGTLVGWSLCIPLSKLRGDYFAAATLILSQAFVLFAANLDSLGGALGFELPTSPMALRNTRPTAWSLVVLSLVATVNLGLWLLLGVVRRSRFGLRLEAARDNAIAAISSGIYNIRIQNTMFVAAGAFAGFAGGLFLYYTGGIVPADFAFASGLAVIICVVVSRSRRTEVLLATLSSSTTKMIPSVLMAQIPPHTPSVNTRPTSASAHRSLNPYQC
jgi:branched-chain amino acid transport system permease protein